MATFIWFILIFSVVVISHEFGHFLVAKSAGIGVKEFYVGFGPTLFHFKKGGTEFKWNLLPLGGACIFEGMDEFEVPGEAGTAADADANPAPAGTAAELAGKTSPQGKSFLDASVWARFATVIAGPVFNMILGFIIAFVMVNMIAVRDPVATQILPGSAAESAGLKDGDRIISMNGERIRLYDDIVLYTVLHEGEEIFLVYERDGELGNTALTPLYSEEYGRYMLGISNSDFIELKGLDFFRYTWYEMRYNLKMTWGSLGMLVRGKIGREDVAGPVGVAVNVVGETYEQTKAYGWQTVLVNMLNIALMLTVNLGILNLLPVPALDGGRLLFVLIEMVRGKPVPREKEAMIHFIGTMLLLVLVVFIFFNDLRNIFWK
ncbi:MAG: site-2 protease family protein [Lachnospiraceae bacterium]|nr:site-2 protease family protein [Lachnospiraceae bacterium]